MGLPCHRHLPSLLLLLQAKSKFRQGFNRHVVAWILIEVQHETCSGTWMWQVHIMLSATSLSFQNCASMESSLKLQACGEESCAWLVVLCNCKYWFWCLRKCMCFMAKGHRNCVIRRKKIYDKWNVWVSWSKGPWKL